MTTLSPTRRTMLAMVALGAAFLGGMPQPARAQDAARTCLGQAASLEAITSGQARRLSDLKADIEGEILKAELCRTGQGYVYAVTTLRADGKVRRLTIDATPPAPRPGSGY